MEYQELIEKHFDGNLSEGEASLLEDLMQSNPEIKNEFDFQQDLIEGLKSKRKSELKARLNTVEIPAVPFFGTMTGQITIGASAVGAIFLFGWLMIQFSPNEELEAVSETSPVVESEAIASKENEEAGATIEAPVVTIDTSKETGSSTKNGVKPTVKETADNKSKKESEKVVSEPTPIKPVQPAIADSFTDEKVRVNVNENNTQELSSLNDLKINNTLDINNITNKRKFQFHYQVRDNQLFLYGTFDKGVYEIYEVNAKESKRVFLYYNKEYYRILLNHKKVLPLEKIDQDELNEIIEALN